MEKVIQTQGKRKSAIAKASLRSGNGIITINKQLLHHYSSPVARLRVSEPLVLAENISHKINIDVVVKGGGGNGHADAARLAIARALVEYEPTLKQAFMDYDRLLLVADIRQKEDRKPNDSKARAARQKSYR